MLVYLLFITAILIIAFLIITPVWRSRRRQQIAIRPFPESWHQLLEQHWRLYTVLPEDVRDQLQRQLRVMMAETEFYGCNDLIVTEKMCVLVLAQASLLYDSIIHHQQTDFPCVLLYPDAFVREGAMMDELGLVAEERHVLLGESWEQGKVILSWVDIERNLAQPQSHHNLVIHEYAHQVDGYDGAMNGTPPVAGNKEFQTWPVVMQDAYDDLCHCVDAGDISFDPYATTNPAEFFAVISEYFFMRPQVLIERYPNVYRLLSAFYRRDPLAWT